MEGHLEPGQPQLVDTDLTPGQVVVQERRAGRRELVDEAPQAVARVRQEDAQGVHGADAAAARDLRHPHPAAEAGEGQGCLVRQLEHLEPAVHGDEVAPAAAHQRRLHGGAVEEVEVLHLGAALVEGPHPLALEVDGVDEHQAGLGVHGARRKHVGDEPFGGLRHPAVDLLPCFLCLRRIAYYRLVNKACCGRGSSITLQDERTTTHLCLEIHGAHLGLEALDGGRPEHRLQDHLVVVPDAARGRDERPAGPGAIAERRAEPGARPGRRPVPRPPPGPARRRWTVARRRGCRRCRGRYSCCWRRAASRGGAPTT